MNPVSAVILTKNEQNNIIDCLKSISWCTEIILIDNSDDATVKLARQTIAPSKLKIFRHPENNNFANLRNFALTKAINDWIFFVDADHRVPKELKQEILKILKQPIYSGYRIRQLDYFQGKLLKHGETAHIYHLLLGKKNIGKWQRPVHDYWQTRQPVGKLQNPIYHYPHLTISEFIDHINRWSTINARFFYKQNVRSSMLQIVAYPIAKFIHNYFWKLGILDGTRGFVFAVLMSFHSFLTRGKLYLIQTNK
jgi:glycosyltransferase involved in cell wall biosynthesis